MACTCLAAGSIKLLSVNMLYIDSVHPETSNFVRVQGARKTKKHPQASINSTYMRYVSIFRRLSNAVIGQKGRFRMGTR